MKLHLLGLVNNKLTLFHAGRDKQMSQVGGEVIRETDCVETPFILGSPVIAELVLDKIKP